MTNQAVQYNKVIVIYGKLKNQNEYYNFVFYRIKNWIHELILFSFWQIMI